MDRWLQQLLEEFIQQRDHFKHQLSDKWDKQELTNIKYDNNERIRKLLSTYRYLEKVRDTILSQQSFDNLDNYIEKIHEDKIDEMKQRFQSLIEEYLKAIKYLEYLDKEMNISTSDTHISDLKFKLSSLKRLNDKSSHTICIVGLEKAGKSTFINALLGFELLPTASERCTQIRTVLKPPPPTDNNDRELLATVKFYDDQEFQIFFSQMTRKTDESEHQLLQRKEDVSRARSILKSKFPEEQFRLTNISDVDKQHRAIIRQLTEYITGEVYVNIVKEVAIYTDKLPGRNYELLDVPGFDSPIKEHRDAGIDAVKSADAFLFLTNGQQPSLTEPQISLLQEIQRNHFEAMSRAFAIITKLDLCQTSAIYRDHLEKTSNELIEKHFRPERIYVACPRIQILDKNSEEYRVIERKLRTFGDEILHGFQQTKQGLNQFIEYELPKTHLKQLIDMGKLRLTRFVIERLDKMKEKQLIPSNLGSTISIDDYIKQQNRENWDQIYEKKIFQPAFEQANCWHTTVITKERANFIDDIKQKFRATFLNLTVEFSQRTFPVEQRMFERYTPSKLQMNAHPIDTEIRERLCVDLEKIVDKTSDILAEHLFHKYVCELETILNTVCPQMKDLYRTKLTLDRCTYEIHALVTRVSRPLIMTTLRYSYLDMSVKKDAIIELIYLAPTVAFNIVNSMSNDSNGDLLGSQIRATAESLADTNEMATTIITALFRK